MSKIPVLSSKEVIKALRAAGFEDAPKKGKGSHIALMKKDPKRLRLVIVPKRKSFLTQYRVPVRTICYQLSPTIRQL